VPPVPAAYPPTAAPGIVFAGKLEIVPGRTT
jgi:hypothetical protein